MRAPIQSTPRRNAFTVLELLVVMAIIAVIIAMIMPALSGARKRSRKQTELNSLKHVGHAWMLYANSNADAALPGFLEVGVQQERVPGVSRGWGVTYKYPDRSPIPLDNANLSGPWTWRLLHYLDYNHQAIHGHLDEEHDVFTLVSEGKKVPYEPAFGYNGLYVGGWWDMMNIDGVMTPRAKYHDHCGVAPPHQRVHTPLTVAQIQRPSDMVTFCAATHFVATGHQTKLPGDTAGHHLVMPPIVERTARWRPAPGNPGGAVDVLESNTFAPLPRHTNLIAVLSADGHVASQGYDALFDQRKWINSADSQKYSHQGCFSQP